MVSPETRNRFEGSNVALTTNVLHHLDDVWALQGRYAPDFKKPEHELSA